MRLKMLSLSSLSLLLSLLLSSCATVTAPDVPVCTEINLARGRCTMTVSDHDIVIDEFNKYMDKTWWELRPTMVYIPYPAWIEIKTTFIKICKKKLIKCDEAISSWDRKIYQVDKNIEDKLTGGLP